MAGTIRDYPKNWIGNVIQYIILDHLVQLSSYDGSRWTEIQRKI